MGAALGGWEERRQWRESGRRWNMGMAEGVKCGKKMERGRALERREERGSYWLVGEEERDAGHKPASWQRA